MQDSNSIGFVSHLGSTKDATSSGLGKKRSTSTSGNAPNLFALSQGAPLHLHTAKVRKFPDSAKIFSLKGAGLLRDRRKNSVFHSGRFHDLFAIVQIYVVFRYFQTEVGCKWNRGALVLKHNELLVLLTRKRREVKPVIR